MRRSLTVVLALLIFFLVVCYAPISSVQASPDTYTFQPSTADAQIYQAFAEYNYGGRTSIRVFSMAGANMRSVLKFDMSGQIPAGATVNSATLSLYYFGREASDAVGRTYWAYRITETNWVEGLSLIHI